MSKAPRFAAIGWERLQKGRSDRKTVHMGIGMAQAAACFVAGGAFGALALFALSALKVSSACSRAEEAAELAAMDPSSGGAEP